jgi:predicted nucleotide-binding protein
MNAEINWSRFRPDEDLSNLAKSLVREIACRFLEQGLGTPHQEKRIELGKDRRVLDDLVQMGLIRNVAQKYYPTFRALSFVPPNVRDRCTTAIEGVLHSLKYLYGSRSFEKQTLRDIQAAADATSRPMTYDSVRAGAQFLRDFPMYSSYLDGSVDEPVSSIQLVENILDFENLPQALEDEMERQLPRRASTTDTTQQRSVDASKRVFVVHGRDERLRAGIFTFLRALHLEPLEWTEAIQLTGKASPYVGEILDAVFRHAQAVVVLLTPDDEAKLRPELLKPNDPAEERKLMGQARPNVLFEAGMSFASHADRTVLVQLGSIRPFSDVAGRHVVVMEGSVAKRHELAVKLKTAGCSVSLDGQDWQTHGDLTPLRADSSSPSTEAQPTSSVNSESGRETSTVRRVIVAPVSRATSHAEYTLVKLDDYGVLIRLSNGVNVRVPKGDYREIWDDDLDKLKLVLTRKYFQGYFTGYEHAEEFFLPR